MNTEEVLTKTKSILADFQLLKDGKWEPDERSINASMKNVRDINSFIEANSKLISLIGSIDVQLLKWQKNVLVEMSMSKELSKTKRQSAIDGIISLLDEIQDELEPNPWVEETIEFRGEKYPVRRVVLPSLGREVIVATYELNSALSEGHNQDSVDLEDTIYYFADEEEFEMTYGELVSYLDRI